MGLAIKKSNDEQTLIGYLGELNKSITEIKSNICSVKFTFCYNY